MKKKRNLKQIYKNMGYTDEQIEHHYSIKREKAKKNRQIKKENNEKNKEIINTIKKDLLGITFQSYGKSFTISNINPTVDGIGFYYTINNQYSDGSSGDFRYFWRFNEYEYKEFIEEQKF